MSTQWLAIQSFQKDQNLLEAINTLSIHTKFALAGIPDQDRAEASDKARETLSSFLKVLQNIVNGTKTPPMLGIDSRLKQLAKSFIAVKDDRRKFSSVLFTKNINHVIQLLSSIQEKDQKELLGSLAELRVLIQQHIHTDASRILGEV